MQKRKNFVPRHDKQHPFEKKRKNYVDRLSDNCKVLYLPWSYTNAVEVDSSLSTVLKYHPFLQLVANSYAPLESDFEIRLN